MIFKVDRERSKLHKHHSGVSLVTFLPYILLVRPYDLDLILVKLIQRGVRGRKKRYLSVRFTSLTYLRAVNFHTSLPVAHLSSTRNPVRRNTRSSYIPNYPA